MIACLQKELCDRKDYLENELVETVYFGGGTPSLLTGSEIRSLLDIIRQDYSMSDSPEITLEANPDDLTAPGTADYRNAGINRLSIGIQTFDDDLLVALNRAHNRSQALHVFDLARAAGFSNISADLIYAIPGEPATRLENDLELFGELNIQHISAYCLTIEPGTAFGNWYKKGKLQPVDEDKAATDYLRIMEFLRSAGFDHYEISNFSLPGMHSRHNTSYWEGKNYLGIGPSAHSYNGTDRQFNVASNARYMDGTENNAPLYETDRLSPLNRANEYIMVRLRTKWGLDLLKLNDLSGFDYVKEHEGYLQELNHSGHILYEDNVIRLTDKGKLLADKIAEDLFHPADD